ncbi:MAG: hypothetical protein ABGX23_03590 [Nautiliaceae bacterium]|jgi:hypothetical protein
MVDPNKVEHPQGSKVKKVICTCAYSGYTFSIAIVYDPKSKGNRIGMRWDGDKENDNDKGYPTSRGYPVWFFVPKDLEEDILNIATKKEALKILRS